MSPEPLPFSLTKHFKEIHLERPDGDFVPDLLLLTESEEKLYVEIVVTHCATQDKKSSGVRLIEIRIEVEEDLSLIRSRKLCADDARVNFINFNPKLVRGDFHKECTQSASVFILRMDGSAIIKKKVKWFEYESKIKGKHLFDKIVEDRHYPTVFKRELERVHLDGLKVCNCFLCRYHRKPTNRQREDTEKSIFCKLHKNLQMSNDAVNCSYYRVDKRVFQFYS